MDFTSVFLSVMGYRLGTGNVLLNWADPRSDSAQLVAVLKV
jgi:hypothetical protein